MWGWRARFIASGRNPHIAGQVPKANIGCGEPLTHASGHSLKAVNGALDRDQDVTWPFSEAMDMGCGCHKLGKRIVSVP